MTSSISSEPRNLVIGLGANIPSKAGDPIETLKTVRPLLEDLISDWISKCSEEPLSKEKLRWRWSPLFETAPQGGPKLQPNFINAVLIVDGENLIKIKPSKSKAIKLLNSFLLMEREFGRNREISTIRWGPRCLDIDFLSWGTLQMKEKNLTLPHPRLFERNFVAVPLGEALNIGNTTPKRIENKPDWP
tara:strand:+ start:1738 stop:2304 length:567 start_codon:yes stop_codon:yes gene_type:complete